MKSCVRFLLLVHILLIAVAVEVHAYPFQEGKKAVLAIEPSAESWSEEERAFSVQVNLDSSNAGEQRKRILYPYSSRFAHVDVIPCNPPLTIAIHGPMTLEERLSALLYANLKLKMLIEEYEALQQRARLLLSGLIAADQKSAGGGKGGRIGQSGPGPSIQSRKEILDRAYRNALEMALSADASLESAARMPLNLAGREREADSPKDESIKAVTGLKKESKEPLIDSKALEARARYWGRPGLKAEEPDTSLPWVIEVTLKGMRFVLQHKVEVAVCSFILFGVAVLVVSFRPR